MSPRSSSSCSEWASWSRAKTRSAASSLRRATHGAAPLAEESVVSSGPCATSESDRQIERPAARMAKPVSCGGPPPPPLRC